MVETGRDKSRLLLVDDDGVFLGVLEKAMAKRGFETIAATGIAEATDKARQAVPGSPPSSVELKSRLHGFT